MAKAKVTLGIGCSTADHEDIIDIDDNELSKCTTVEQREDLLHEYWKNWSNNYVEGSIDIVDAGK